MGTRSLSSLPFLSHAADLRTRIEVHQSMTMNREAQVEQTTSTSSSTARTSAAPGRATAKDKGSSGITWGITIISAVSLILTLLGYGVALAVEIMFGMPHETVYSSVLDLIGLSVYAINSVLLRLGEITWQPLFDKAWPAGLGAAACMFAFLSFLALLHVHRGRVRGRTPRFWRYFKPPTAQDSGRQLLGKSAVFSSLFGGIVFATPFFIVSAVMVIMVLISIIPVLGLKLGQHYLREFVVTPLACVPVVPRQAMLQAPSSLKKTAPTLPAANCVTLLKDGTPVASGRVVVSTSTAIVLFEPDSGSVRRVPVGELTVLPTGTLPPASKPESDTGKQESKRNSSRPARAS